MSTRTVRWRRLGAWALALLGLYVLLAIPSLYGDYLWFEQVGYTGVFLTILGYRIALFAAVTVVTAAVLLASLRLALERVGDQPAGLRTAYVAAVVVVSGVIGLRYAASWDVVLRFLHAVPFGRLDPVYGREVGFYVFDLPLFRLAVGYVRLLAFAALGVGLVVYAREYGATQLETPVGEEVAAFDTFTFLTRLREHAFEHLVPIAGVLLVAVGAGFYLDRFGLVYSTRGTVFGVGATDQVVFRPLLVLLALTAVLGGLVFVASVWWRDSRAVTIPVAVLVGFLVFGNAAGFVYQDFIVEPDELNKEARYIENEIEFTSHAYALDRIEARDFPVAEEISMERIEANPGTIDNIRLWDPRPLLTTYNELQIFRTYYTFTDVDVDRYEIDGEETEVMVSAREIDFEALPPESQSWVNRHLVYTHGFGIVMTPVGQVTGEGLPELFVRNIPPNSSVGIEITQPRIYYGENTDTYAVVNTGTEELDYPSGDQNVYTSYAADGGVQLDSALKEVVYAAKFGAPSIVLSDSVTRESRLQFNRDVQTRARTIAPFLEYDSDPYIVASDGRLYWIYDAYTTTDGYPYARPIRFKGERVNYVRNSVKVVIDAYTGETTYYVADADDPVIQTYERAFPDLFEPLEAMPTDLRDHIRYPEDAFSVQATMYLDYHMKEPQVFYNKEDSWRIPDEVTRGERVPMDPYYIIMTIPGEQTPEFVMIQPYIPRGKENMIGWLAARSDRPNYGRLEAFLFSKQQLVFGPMQIESRIDQDTEISQRITLWSQAGSSVIRGNLLAIPIDDTIIYVEPLFLESREEGSLPELKRVIIAQGDRLTMQPTLEQALAVRFGTGNGTAGPQAPGGPISADELSRLRTLYDEAEAALREGDFETYARRISQIGELLDSIESEPAANATATA